jgi:hypothetical protein
VLRLQPALQLRTLYSPRPGLARALRTRVFCRSQASTLFHPILEFFAFLVRGFVPPAIELSSDGPKRLRFCRFNEMEPGRFHASVLNWRHAAPDVRSMKDR